MYRKRWINTRVVIDLNTGEVLEREGYWYTGPVAEAGTANTYTDAWRFYDTANSTAEDAQDATPVSLNVDTTYVVRFRVYNAGNKNEDAQVYQLEANNTTKTSGWFNVTGASTYVQTADATGLTNGTAITSGTLTGATGTWNDTDGEEVEDGASSSDVIVQAKYTEYWYSFTIVSGDVDNNDSIEIRPNAPDNASWPTITVNEAATPISIEVPQGNVAISTAAPTVDNPNNVNIFLPEIECGNTDAHCNDSTGWTLTNNATVPGDGYLHFPGTGAGPGKASPPGATNIKAGATYNVVWHQTNISGGFSITPLVGGAAGSLATTDGIHHRRITATNDGTAANTYLTATLNIGVWDIDYYYIEPSPFIIGYEPTLSFTSNVSVSVPKADLTIDSAAPAVAVTAHIPLSVPQADITLTSEAPTLNVTSGANVEITVPQCDATLSSEALSLNVTQHIPVSIPQGDLSLSSEVPSASTTKHIPVSVPQVDIALSSEAPGVSATRNVPLSVPQADVVLSSDAPSVLATAGVNIQVASGDASLSSEAPTIAVTEYVDISVTGTDLSLSSESPAVSATKHVTTQVPASELVLSTEAPSVLVTSGIYIDVPQADMEISSSAPSVSKTANVSISVPTCDAVLDSAAPQADVTLNIPISVPSCDLSVSSNAPDISTSGAADITIPQADLVITSEAAVVNVTTTTVSTPTTSPGGGRAVRYYSPIRERRIPERSRSKVRDKIRQVVREKIEHNPSLFSRDDIRGIVSDIDAILRRQYELQNLYALLDVALKVQRGKAVDGPDLPEMVESVEVILPVVEEAIQETVEEKRKKAEKRKRDDYNRAITLLLIAS